MEKPMDGRDRRECPRLEGHFRVDLLNMGDDPKVAQFEPIVQGEALDVSLHGMRVRANYKAAVGSYISVIIYFKNFESLCLCQVVWSREITGEYVYGLYLKQWSRLDPVLARKLKAMEESENRLPNCSFISAFVPAF